MIRYLILFLPLYIFAFNIKNFDKNIEINNAIIEDGVIVKTKISKDRLGKILNKKIHTLAKLKDSNIYLVDTNNSLAFANELNKRDFIIYAQPDIIQKRENNSNQYEYQKILNTFDTHIDTKNINIAIIDDGFDFHHEDLKETNVVFSFDSDNRVLDASFSGSGISHGTEVAGLIFAKHNGIGIDGIAPSANLIAIKNSTNKTSSTILAFYTAKLAKANIINCSWNSPILLEPISDVIKDIANSNIAVAISAGNEAKEILPLSREASIKEAIVVGSPAKYSNYGSSVDIIVPSNSKSTKNGGGYVRFGGTSASCAIFSGLLALQMASNPTKSIDELVNDIKRRIDGR